ncbi:T9SS type A sorting domain-containing protein [Flavobacterium dankookense]|uniref:Putative secreted protein (Por secretion system target) n=1 Tax=Flavobacterium dankookense TaxID=706186 RepID=A0A4R6Q9R0_9FLAO|nr:T9SS type A sorting domain-containing protein [Flavobacterium dankookense]TDP59364.1 putative secreted protein (Por secretion system target) [Flavobacterium dankookense]
MKKIVFILLISYSANSQIITFPDANFKTRLLQSASFNDIAKNDNNISFKIDSNNDGQIQVSEALLVNELNLNSFNFPVTSYISDLTGLESFQNLRILNCSKNNLNQLNIQPLTLLEELRAGNNLLTTIDISNLSNLKILSVHNNLLSTIIQNNNTSLEGILIYNNLLVSLDLTVYPSLSWISCKNNMLNSLNVSGLTQIDEIECGNNMLTSLDISGLSTLRFLGCASNQINTIDLNTLSSLNILTCENNPISTINLNGLTNLGMLDVSNTLLTSIDASNSGVEQLFVVDCPNLQTINARNGAILDSDPDLLFFAFRIYNNPNLISICTDDGEQNELIYTDYNTSGNVLVFNGINCNIPVQVAMSVTENDKVDVKIFPNPSETILNIVVSEMDVLKQIEFKNLIGQIVLTVNNLETIDVSSLQKGTYLIEVETSQGNQTKKFIKI